MNSFSHESGQQAMPPQAFIWPVRIYYEDTDAGGVVYHANYLRFMERARTEWLRQRGFEQDQLLKDPGILMVIGHIDIRYLKPARFNDELYVKTSIQKWGKASMVFAQEIYRAGDNPEPLTTSTVKVVCVSAETFKSTAIPTVIREQLQ